MVGFLVDMYICLVFCRFYIFLGVCLLLGFYVICEVGISVIVVRGEDRGIERLRYLFIII